jgi:ABC-type branched-subunit amino acid transport system substrate-binding protein
LGWKTADEIQLKGVALMNKRLIWVVLAAALVIGLLAYLLSRNGKPNGDPGQIRVAAVLNLTGPSARFDAVKRQTLGIALERFKAQNPGRSIDIREFDAAGGPEATNVAVRQATEWGASYFLSGTSPTALAIASQVRGRTPPLIQVANAANPDFGPPRPGEYRFWPDWRQEAEVIVGLLKEQKINKVFLIHSADPYSDALTKELRTQGTAITGFDVRDQQYDPASTPDFRPGLLRAKLDGVQALVIFGLPPGIKALMSQMGEVGWDRALIGGVNINLAVTDYDAANLKGGLWVVETEAMKEELPQGSEAQLFRAAYKQRYNEAPPFHSLYFADALYYIAAAHNKNNELNVPEAERLKSIRSFDSASGRIEVGDDGVLRFVMGARNIK